RRIEIHNTDSFFCNSMRESLSELRFLPGWELLGVFRGRVEDTGEGREARCMSTSALHVHGGYAETEDCRRRGSDCGRGSGHCQSFIVAPALDAAADARRPGVQEPLPGFERAAAPTHAVD